MTQRKKHPPRRRVIATPEQIDSIVQNTWSRVTNASRDTGIPPESIQQWLSGRRSPRRDMLLKLLEGVETRLAKAWPPKPSTNSKPFSTTT
ncbi:MAG: helix-turn-helix domain-containing protein [Parvibaculales bacterium]